ncbi:hypothetical protein HWV23_11840 [Natronomonas halophila]|uniref:hypothetical protein n=1 Tax=Natronomonas halophila TaxID=2747817 RepID=UPI0015B60C70|nr:hypothetical protein [Natronomonas halophila]QLD86386.1 hypothetical protein HWV23_11840 [Natronomonas halophila]
MACPRRRRLLGAIATSLAIAGCVDRQGHNPILRFRNPVPEPAEVRLTIHREFVGEGTEELVFDDTVSVDASDTRNLEVFTAEEDQYRVRVERDSHSVEFPTRPICDSALTVVTLRSSGLIEYQVEFCEGSPRSGTSRSS